VYKDKTFLAIIPARGGSKRLPRKNILELNGKPLIAWSIEAGLKSKYVDKVVVSSDDKEILEYSQYYGADTIKRPDNLASDTSTSFDAIKHTIDNVDKYDYVVLLQPTSPLRTAEQIDDAIELLEKKKADAVVSVCEMDHSPLWSNTLPDDGNMDNFLRDEVKNSRSQDLKKYDYVILLQATSPLRNENHVDEAIELLESKNASAVVSVCETDHSPLWSNTLDDSLSMKGFLKEGVLNKRSQDLEKYYRLNGAIYICKVEKLLKEKSFFLKDNIFAFKMDKHNSIDIDEEVDFQMAKLNMKGK